MGLSGADDLRGESGRSTLRRVGRSVLRRVGDERVLSVVTLRPEWRGGGGGGGAWVETRLGFGGGGGGASTTSEGIFRGG
jgi:hypothetical protein